MNVVHLYYIKSDTSDEVFLPHTEWQTRLQGHPMDEAQRVFPRMALTRHSSRL